MCLDGSIDWLQRALSPNRMHVVTRTSDGPSGSSSSIEKSTDHPGDLDFGCGERVGVWLEGWEFEEEKERKEESEERKG